MNYRLWTFLGAIMIMAVYVTAHAVPAKKVRCTLRLGDGSTVEATLMGDENLHYYLTDDGRALQEDNRQTRSDGRIDGTCHFTDLDSLRLIHAERFMQRNSRRLQKGKLRRKALGDECNPTSGSKRGLVILVNYADREMIYGQQGFDRFFNQPGFSEYGMKGSVHDYFFDQSYGQFDLTFDVVGPYTLSKGMAYYGENDASGDDMHCGEMVAEACYLADMDVDFSNYDWDGDGFVDQIYMIYAGFGESQGGGRDTIWPHEWTLSEANEYGDGEGSIQLDGVRIDTYGCSCELTGRNGSIIDGIGTACHEFSHCLGIPDMYDVLRIADGMVKWDLMDDGCYNGDITGRCPSSYTSYERIYCGWLEPTVLTTTMTVEQMQPITSAPEAYLIYNSAYPQEYYLLENHQFESWDQAAYGHGMLILHVDFDPVAWAGNTVNSDQNHQRMTYIPADNTISGSSNSMAGDTWPGTKGKTELSATTTPAATLYNANALGEYFMEHTITDITEQDGLISFRFIAHPASTDALPHETIEPYEPLTPVYDLSGRRMHNATPLRPGIYITKGRKVVVR